MADQITFTDKQDNQYLPTVPAEKKVSAADMNEIKTVTNTNSSELNTTTTRSQTNETGIATLTSDRQIETSGDQTEIRLHRMGGSEYGTAASPSTLTTFTFATSGQFAPVNEGMAIVNTSAASYPDWGQEVDHDHGAESNFSAGNYNQIMLVWLNSELHAWMLGVPISLVPPVSDLEDIAGFAFYWSSDNLNRDNNVGISNGQEIITILDVSASTNVDGSSIMGRGPVYDSTNKSLVFTSDSQHYLTADDPTGITSQPYTIAAVFTPATGVTNAETIVSAEDAATFLISFRDLSPTPPVDNIRVYAGAWSDPIEVTLDEVTMLIVVVDGANSAIYKDTDVAAAWTGDLGSNSMGDDLMWGAAGASVSNWEGEGYAIVGYNGAKNATERATIRAFMVAKYGLT